MKITIIFERFVVLMWKYLNIQLPPKFLMTWSVYKKFSVVNVGSVFTKTRPGSILTAVCFEIELCNNKLHGLLPPGGLVSPSGGWLLCDQVLHFASIKLYQASWMWYHFSCHHVTVFVVVQLNCIFNTEKNLVYTSTQKRNNCGAGISNFNTDEFSWTAGNLTSGTRALVLVENPFPRLTPWRSCILY